jgi:hypothetical protein
MAFHRPAPAALLRCAAAAVLGLACTVSPAAFRVAHPGQPAPAAGQHANFNSDGFDDLAVGASFEDLGSALDAGAVNVLNGSAAGLTGAGSQLFTHAGSLAPPLSAGSCGCHRSIVARRAPCPPPAW